MEKENGGTQLTVIIKALDDLTSRLEENVLKQHQLLDGILRISEPELAKELEAMKEQLKVYKEKATSGHDAISVIKLYIEVMTMGQRLNSNVTWRLQGL